MNCLVNISLIVKMVNSSIFFKSGIRIDCAKEIKEQINLREVKLQ